LTPWLKSFLLVEVELRRGIQDEMIKRKDTVLTHAGNHPDANHGVVNPPVYHASTIVFPTVKEFEERGHNPYEGVQYGRTGTPTTMAFEEAITAMHKGFKTVAYPSGLAAISGALLSVLKAGDEVLVVDSVYAPSRKRVCDNLLARLGVDTRYYDPLVGAEISEILGAKTRAVFMESPGSLTFEMQDVPAIAKVCRDNGVVSIIDNTWSSPYFFQPLEHGVDIVVEAATKYVVGHSDAMLGTATVADEDLFRNIKSTANSLGYSAAPDDCYLGTRGLRTLSVRLQRHQENAMKVATWLREQRQIDRVLYPALPEDPGHAIWTRDHSGASGLFGVVFKPAPEGAVEAMLDDLELFGIGASWGGYESLAIPTQPGPLRTATAWPYKGPSIRLHIGLEDPDDLITDLKAGLDRFSSTS